MKVTVVGSGNVAQAIALELKRIGVELVEIVARSGAGRELANRVGCHYTSDPAHAMEADLYIISVSDGAIASVSSMLAVGDTGVVVHTAGSVDKEVLNQHHNYGVLYPLQTFTKGRMVNFKEIPIFIEYNNRNAHLVIQNMAEQLSDRVQKMEIEQRCKLHLAAVFACNFTNHMYAVSELLLEESGVEFDLVKPLIKETAQKAIDCGSPRDIQTGPAIRNDFVTKGKHCHLLDNNKILKTIYTNLSNNIWGISKKI